MESTLFMIKPDAVLAGKIGLILAEVEKAGFEVAEMRMVRLTPEKARRFYAVHEGKPFLADLVSFMSSGPAVPCLLRRDNAIKGLRDLIGATDPKEAKPGTIRALYAESKQNNAVHASDSPESAATEIPFFFDAVGAAR
ncbi:MAG TPA: nucleoside-diphosphate kinase [Candidatus Eisenbacteria bacterium]|nr:nucleoside-diphosphate kinase [Candidatus Eisenbacteria bacterium]